MARLADELPVLAVSGVLNGTCNFVLDRMQAGARYGDAIREARERGLAEADPYLDVSGLDAVYKLALLATAAFGVPVTPDEIVCEGLDRVSRTRLARARESGGELKLVAEARRHRGGVTARVGVRSLPPAHPLAGCREEGNRLLVETADGTTHRLDGLGAGRWPTTCAVVADLLDLRRTLVAPTEPAAAAERRKRGTGT